MFPYENWNWLQFVQVIRLKISNKSLDFRFYFSFFDRAGQDAPRSLNAVKYQDIDKQFGKILHNGHFYHKCGVSRGAITYYRCARTRAFSCKATLKVNKCGQITDNGVPHNHEPKTPMAANNKSMARTKLIYNENSFYRHSETGRKIHWRCSSFRLTQCIVRLHTDNSGHIQLIRGKHNHENNSKLK